MKLSERGEALVKRWEGCVLRAYADPKTGGEPWTIGWGHTGPDVHPGLVWTQDRADDAFLSDIVRYEDAVMYALKGSPCTQGQFDALTSFCYNLGPRRLAESTLMRLHRAGDYEGAALQFRRWISKGTPAEKGLRNRRADEEKVYRS